MRNLKSYWFSIWSHCFERCLVLQWCFLQVKKKAALKGINWTHYNQSASQPQLLLLLSFWLLLLLFVVMAQVTLMSGAEIRFSDLALAFWRSQEIMIEYWKYLCLTFVKPTVMLLSAPRMSRELILPPGRGLLTFQRPCSPPHPLLLPY